MSHRKMKRREKKTIEFCQDFGTYNIFRCAQCVCIEIHARTFHPLCCWNGECFTVGRCIITAFYAIIQSHTRSITLIKWTRNAQIVLVPFKKIQLNLIVPTVCILNFNTRTQRCFVKRYVAVGRRDFGFRNQCNLVFFPYISLSLNLITLQIELKSVPKYRINVKSWGCLIDLNAFQLGVMGQFLVRSTVWIRYIFQRRRQLLHSSAHERHSKRTRKKISLNCDERTYLRCVMH